MIDRQMLDPEFSMRLDSVRLMIVHPGAAHMDDYLSVALIKALRPSITYERREPTAEEIADPTVLVADVGMMYDPEIMCFDHHQDRGLPASFVLILKAAGVWARFVDCFPWATLTSEMDTRGPTEVCRARGIPEGVGREFLNPIADCILSDFESREDHFSLQHAFTLSHLDRLGSSLWSELSLWSAAIKEAELAVAFAVETSGTRLYFLFYDRVFPDSNFMALIDRALIHRGYSGGFAGTITRSRRNNGWRLYRISDHPHVDFSLVHDDHRIVFAHANGFMAETRDLLNLPELHTLMEKVIR